MDLKSIRISLGLTQRKASEYLGISLRKYQQYESKDNSFYQKSKYDDYCKKLLAHPEFIPVNVSSDDFAYIIQKGSYYVDKTGLIEELINKNEFLVLFNRPRRFGKSLNLSMLYSFFDLSVDSKELFKGLKISENDELCERHQNQYPVIFLKLKDMSYDDFDSFLDGLTAKITNAFEPYVHLLSEASISERDIGILNNIYNGNLSKVELITSIFDLSRILFSYYSRRVIIIIDEYDVPLEKAALNGYFDQALNVIRNLFSSALKSNQYVAMSVLSGCLRVSKESIFTGLNNVNVRSMLDKEYSKYFGFTEDEVDMILKTYNLKDKKQEVKENYDGFLIKGTSVYCPYDVMSYVRDHLSDRDSIPQHYWINSSGNEIIRTLLQQSDSSTRNEIEALIAGETVLKTINLNLSYRDLYENINNVYAVLLASGYLTAVEQVSAFEYRLAIPNKEVQEIYELQIMEWLNKDVYPHHKREGLLRFVLDGDASSFENGLNDILRFIVGIHDYSRNQEEKEAFYHGVLLGILVQNNVDNRYEVQSNKEAGLGYGDILIRDYQNKIGVIIENKYASSMKDMQPASIEALKQIEDNRYEDYFSTDFHIRKIGIGFYKKACRVSALKENSTPA